MNRRSKHRKFVVVTAIVLTSLVLLFMIVLAFGKHALKKHQITYRSLSYNFPSTLKVEGLNAAPAETFRMEFEILEVRWSWSSLWKRRIVLKHLYAEDGGVELMPEGPSREKESPSTEKGNGLPELELEDIRMEGIRLDYLADRDTIQASWDDLYLSSAIVRDSIIIDSLYLDGAYMGLHSGERDTTIESSTSLNMEGIPWIVVNYLELDGAEILTRNPSGQQHLMDLDLVIGGWKSTELLNFRVDRLDFVYQDTLEVDLVLENGILNSSFQTELSDLNLEIPGLSLQIAQSSIHLEEEPRVALTLDRSYLTVGIIRQVVPSLRTTFNPDLRDGTRIYLDGKITMNGKSVQLEGLNVSMLDSTSMTLLGSVSWADKTAMDLVLSVFRSSRSDLTRILARKGYNDFYYWPTGITGDVEIHGGPENLDITGTLDTDQGLLEAMSRVRVSDQGNLYFLLDLRSDSIHVDSITGILPLSVPYGDVHFSLALHSGKSPRSDSLLIRIHSERLFALDKDLNRISYTFYSDAQLDSMHASIDDEFIRTRVALVTPEAGNGETRVQGKLEHLDPHQVIPGLQEGSISAYFKGAYRITEGSYQAELDLDQMQFVNSENQVAFHDIRIQVDGQSEQISLKLKAGKETLIHASTGTVFPDFIFPEPNWFMQWPTTEVTMNLHLDEDVMAALTGIQAGLSLDTLLLVKNAEAWEARMRMSELSYDGFEVENIEFDALSQMDSLGGLLRMTGMHWIDRDLGDVDFLIRGEDQKLAISLDHSIEEIGIRNFLSLMMDELDSGFKLRLYDQDGTTRMEAVNVGTEVSVLMDSLNLGPLYSIATHKDNLQAQVNGNAILDTRAQTASWEADLVARMEEVPGLLHVGITGRKDGPVLWAQVDVEHDEAKAEATVVKEEEQMAYTTRLTMLDLALLQYVPNWPAELDLSGNLNGTARGILGEDFSVDGYLVAEDMGMMHHMNSTPYRILQDTLFLRDHQIVFQDFQIQDADDRKLSINGSVTAFPELLVDLSVHSDSIAFVHSVETQTPLSGQLNGFADLNVTGGPEVFRISGKVQTLPKAKIHYASPHSFELVDASQIVTFRKLDTLEKEELKSAPDKPDPVLEWDLELTLNQTDVLIMLDEIHQEYLQIAADGQLNLRTGYGITPLVYGSVTSSSGRAFIKPPSIPELNMFIDDATLTWNGLLDEPLISFRGYDLIKASTSGLSSTESKSFDLVDYKVYAILDQVSLSEFDLQFDLEVEDSETQVLIASLPPDTRQAYALNLLVFGRIGTEKIKGNTMLADQVTRKLNELARRNFKNAGLSFSSSNSLVGTDESNKKARTDLSYSLSRGFIHNKLSFSVGGSVGVYLDDFTVLPPSHLIGDVKLNYKLSETPSISLTGTRQNVYLGIIDGMVTQESVGLTFKKSYHRFSEMFGTKKGGKTE